MTSDVSHLKQIKTARIAGLWYLLMAISGIMGFLVFHQQIFEYESTQKTLENLTNLESTARIRVLLEFAIIVSQALTAVWFYKLFRNINQWAALSVALWGTVNAIAIMISAISMGSAIEVANSASSIDNKLILIELLSSIIKNSWAVGGLFFGLWLIPLGYIVVSSKRMPHWLGITLIVGGFGYILSTFLSFTGLSGQWTDILTIPATIGEFWMIGYLFTYGIRPEKN